MPKESIVGASPRRRFIRRAQTLKEDEDFSALLARARTQWRARYPEFAIPTQRGIPPDLVSGRLEFALPPDLDAYIEQSSDRGSATNRDQVIERHRRIDIAHAAFAVWRSLVQDVCETVFPPRYFSSYTSRHAHPAHMFISCCLVYAEKHVPESAIFSNGYSPALHPFDPTDDALNPEIAGLRAEVATLKEILADRLPLESAELIGAAEGVGRRASMELGESQWPMTSAEPWRFVPIERGLTRSDWDAMYAEVAEILKSIQGDDPIDGYVKELKANGKNIRQISRILGVDEKTISKRFGR
ncbi:MAG: hypothetical protein ACR2OO_14315 [Thermomicrobiales bacterium]